VLIICAGVGFGKIIGASMYSLERCLIDCPLALLRTIAELRGVTLHSRGQREMAVELAAVLAAPDVTARSLAGLSPGAAEALEALAAAGGRLQATLFQRRYGEIRPFGPGRLAREQPWLSPTGPAEELWYRGWIFRGFADVDGTATEFIFVPDEVLGLLPRPRGRAFDVPSAPAPTSFTDAGDALVQDVTTLLAMVQVEGMRRRQGRWHSADLTALATRLTVRESASPDAAGNSRLALLLHLTERFGWMQEDERGHLRLQAPAVRRWLQADRAAQWQALWAGWRDDETWDDLRRLPELTCEGGWHNDPVGTRRRLLSWLGQLQPGSWHRLDAVIATLKAVAPDFLRPDGDYDSWYIRPTDGSNYLRGFEHWDDVEGRLARYLITGPLHWLGVIALDAGGERAALTAAGHALIREELPPAAPLGSITVARDFAALVPATAASFDRFRVARFAAWEASPVVGSAEPFRYRITRTALRRAESQGITAARVLAFLRERVGDALPENVARALARWPQMTKDEGRMTKDECRRAFVSILRPSS
jgi:hypothetical protein